MSNHEEAKHYGVYTKPGADGRPDPVMRAATPGDAVKCKYDGWTLIEAATADNAAEIGLGAKPRLAANPAAESQAAAAPQQAQPGPDSTGDVAGDTVQQPHARAAK